MCFSGLRHVYTDLDFQPKNECSDAFVGLDVFISEQKTIHFEQSFKSHEKLPSPNQSSLRFKHCRSNLSQSKMRSLIIGQLIGSLDRCMYSDELSSLASMMVCLCCCGYSCSMIKSSIMKLGKFHRYLNPALQKAFLFVFNS